MAVWEFGLLGPVVVLRDGTTVPVARGGQQAVLAALLLKAGHLVSTRELTEVLWGDEPPPTAGAALHNQVRRLRACLGPGGEERICTEPGGYLIRVQPGELDLSRAKGLLAGAREAVRDGDWQQVSAQAAAGLLLWRAEPLAGVESHVLAREVPWLAEIGLQLSELRLEGEIRLDRAAGAVSELRQLCAAHPLREHLHTLLMLALQRCGRRAEALAAYQAARRVLIQELGSEPAAELQELHQQILTGTTLNLPEPAGAADGSPGAAWEETGQPSRSTPPGCTAGTIPRQLPAPVRHFTGRHEELAGLSGLLGDSSAPSALVISAICGTAGVGKTALAIEWAHQVADRFPDGQLHVNLRGYDPNQPSTPGDALAGFLRALGMAGEQIPAETAERAAAYRSLLAGRRVLIVLDNARTVEQVRPLLPGGSTCTVVVTSRDMLTGLVARDGAERLELDLLPAEESAGLLRELIGDRAAADPDATAALTASCARLPLALRLAAELANARPAVPLATLAADLVGQQNRLDLLDAGGDTSTAVRAVFSWSYQHLDDASARTFRMAGLYPGLDFEANAAAALTGTTVAQAVRLLGQLARAHLIQPAGADRYGMHDLLRGYARELATTHDSPGQRRAALTRLFDRYLHTAAAAMDALYPAERHLRPVIPRPASPALPITSRTGARAWLDGELANLIASIAHAADHGWPRHATCLSQTVSRHLDTAGRFAEARIIHGHAVRAAKLAGDRPAEVAALIGLGLACYHQSRPEEADASYERALTLACKAGDEDGQARALNYLAISAVERGNYQEAADKFAQALQLFRSRGEDASVAYALSNLGVVYRRQGCYRLAADHQERAAALFGELGDRLGQSMVLGRLGLVNVQQGDYVLAGHNLRQSLVLCREFSDRLGEADALGRLGLVELRQHHHQEAASHLHQALAGFRELGDRSKEAEVLDRLGELFLATGRTTDAHAHYKAALDASSAAQYKPEQAVAHDGLAQAYLSSADLPKARYHLQRALALYTEIGAPEADDALAQLLALDAGQTSLEMRLNRNGD